MANILCIGEVLLRFSTTSKTRLENEDNFNLNYGGCESNIALNLSQFKHNVTFKTALPDNDFKYGVINLYNKYQVKLKYEEIKNSRLGIYFVEEGFGQKATNVIYDRKNSAITKMENLDESLLKDIEYIVVSGITLALNEDLKNKIIEFIKKAFKKNIKIIFDGNYRSKLWTIDEAKKAIQEILPYVNTYSATILDAQNFLDINIKKEFKTYEEELTAYYKKIKEKYPNIQIICSTKREVINYSNNNITGYIFDTKLIQTKTMPIPNIIDRIGTGDAFLAGIIHGLIKYHALQKTIDFATANNVLKHYIKGDYNQYKEEEILDYLNNTLKIIKR